MFGLIFDAVALIVILYIVERGAEVDFFMTFLAAAVIWGCNLIIGFGLGERLGAGVIVPMFIADAFILWGLFKLSVQRALIATALFVGYKVAFILAISALFEA